MEAEKGTLLVMPLCSLVTGSLIQKLHLGHPLTQDPLRVLFTLLVVSVSFFVVLILLCSVTDCCYVALLFSAPLDFSV